ncbi:MAG: hypothetical protein MUF14_05250 [Hyphomonadaceae bacterium]|jgi:hypothetical protein|nr:hypothetical protein [Hyphomonadaceae bacterium]
MSRASRKVTVTDHALVRFLERAGGLDVEGLRAHLALSLEAATQAANAIGGGSEVKICVDGLAYVLRPDRSAPDGCFVLATVTPEAMRHGKGG